jgi:multisubunit Na+/H+ antiporter MnhF subunit
MSHFSSFDPASPSRLGSGSNWGKKACGNCSAMIGYMKKLGTYLRDYMTMGFLLLLSASTLIMGILIYQYARGPTLVTRLLQLDPNINGYIPRFIVVLCDWLPDFLWASSFSLFLWAIWGSIEYWIVAVPYSIGVGSEVLQYMTFLPGTFDLQDVVAYSAVGFLFLLIKVTINSIKGYVKIT